MYIYKYIKLNIKLLTHKIDNQLSFLIFKTVHFELNCNYIIILFLNYYYNSIIRFLI